MTKIAISPNVNGTGTFTLAAPDSNTDRTLTLPDAGGSVVLNEGSGTFKIDSSGNVGIGTETITEALTVEGNIRSNSSIRASGLIAAGDATAPHFSFSANNNMGMFRATTNTLGFSTNGAERIRINGSGNVGIGTTTPSAPLDVQDAALCLQLNRTGVNGAVARFEKQSATVGSISVTASSTAYNTSSDHRLKEDVQPMVNATDRVLSLKPVNFAWKVDGTRVDGFLAHEAQAVVPEAVHGLKDEVDADGNPMYQGIDQSKLVPLLTAALQEALADIATLKAEVAALKGASA